ncbi:hypothetical protein QA612_14160 [Evansella sp. AB-P1]|uniref:hypothetical protein n=1 Tax=Evansella sp. AB-P1 TaxID=3037653 RepID=UPI00241CFB95|nr:hypothetical protein [Evansella sp. AB-P1]MDG5788623.1 hypothetical protein [Evansella sp. AB-P1]
MVKFVIFISFFILLASCTPDTESETGDSGVYTTRNPTAEDVLASNEDDIFVFHDVVYVYAEDIDWVKQLDLTLGDEVLEINHQSISGKDFVNGTASKLPLGTKIYEPREKGDIYIAIVNGEEVRYLGWREG